MEYQTFFLLTTFILTCIYVLISPLGRRKSGRTVGLPPGPYPFPVIGTFFHLGDKPHKSLAILSKKYGPLMSLKLGTTTTIVVSSPETAKEILNNHDQSFSGRPIFDLVRPFDHYKYSITFLPVSDRWRKLRRICKEHLFSLQILDASRSVRAHKVEELVDHVNRCAIIGESVDIGEAAFTTMVNVISNAIFSTNLAHLDSISSQEFRDNLWALIKVGGTPNLVDYFPILVPFDPQRLRRKGNVYATKIYTIFENIVTKRFQERTTSSTRNDVLDSLIDTTLNGGDSDFGQHEIIHLFISLFLAGTDTTSSTVEWAIAELMRNPDKMTKARCEIAKTIGNDKKTIQESDVSKLPYLQAVVKETLRLHPPVPFLIPHLAICDVEIQNFIVPKDSQVLCNVWAIGRDPDVWSTPESFIPERFLATELDFRGHDFELIPFGSGRRSCPGLNLGDKILHLILGSLIYKFDWKLEGGVEVQDMDMSEKFGATMPKSSPLKAIPIKA